MNVIEYPAILAQVPMIYRNAVLTDIPAILELQKKYHVATISDSDKLDGFVTTLFTKNQFEELITDENGIVRATDEGRIVAYAMAASWAFSRAQMHKRYPILITFINHINTRSYEAHTGKLGLDVIKSFTFNQNNYYALGYDTAQEVR